ncbi:hypothetical protein I302_102175 [Kwoniella bestiolae CBS 10118]|uniref:OPA3-like protein n=1 Tax=Kwoniella bestiolae CBS 10118 TaxID=1296100 RepID=A0A1B9GEB5_9TREE|nr:hypothetical protein I302_00862 [Kwoniella bestiolae CBS 10118]OCF29360.1 hypothetical protein I302_00862 [Kwoniella bestiolae CBS 10118]
MASVKIFSLAVKTLAKPIANTIKAQAAQHDTFKNICIGLAQRMHRTEARMRMGLLNAESGQIKPLNDARAIQNGATTLAETFLFLVGAGLIVGESYRSSRKEEKRRDAVQDRLHELESEVKRLNDELDGKVEGGWREGIGEVRERSDNIEKILDTIVNNGLKAGWLSLGHKEQGEILPLLEASRAEEGLSTSAFRIQGGEGAISGQDQ